MTTLVGRFEFDLPRRQAVEACVDAIDGLGWDIEAAGAGQIVSYANGGPGQEVRKIEVLLDDLGGSTEIRIIGTDSDPAPFENEPLIAELNRARNAIEACIDDAIEAIEGSPQNDGPPSQQQADESSSDRPQFAAQRELVRTRVLENGGQLQVRVADLLTHFGLPEFNARAMDTVHALLQTVGIEATPALTKVNPDESVTLTARGSPPARTTEGDRGADRDRAHDRHCRP